MEQLFLMPGEERYERFKDGKRCVPPPGGRLDCLNTKEKEPWNSFF